MSFEWKVLKLFCGALNTAKLETIDGKVRTRKVTFQSQSTLKLIFSATSLREHIDEIA